MKKLELYLMCVALIMVCNVGFGQTVNLPCQTENDADVGLDRKDWNNGSTAIHSEGYLMNFDLPPASDFDPCKKILVVEVDFIINSIDQSNMPGDCPMITTFFSNLYVGCPDTAPISCPTSNILDEFPSTPISNQTLVYTCPPDEFPFGDVLGVDIIPVADTGCSTGQSMVSAGSVIIDFEICVTLTVGDADIENPVDLGPDVPSCTGQTVQLDAGSGYTDYDWDPDGQTSQMINVGPGIYTVTVTDAAGCTDTDVIEVTANDPTVSITSDDADLTICIDEMTTLTANTSESDIEWSNGDMGPTTTVSPGSYSVTVTDGAGCMGEDMITISSFPNPIVSVDPTSPTACDNGVTLVTATSGFVDYDWSDGQSGNPVLLPPGMYTVIVTDGNGCTGETMFEVFSVSPPNAGSNASLSVCNDGSTYDIEGELGPNDNGGTWNDDDGSGLNLNTNDDAVNFSGVSPGTYDFSYTVSGSSACPDDEATVTVTVLDQPDAGNNNSITICIDEMNIDIEGLLGSFDSGGTWSDDDGTGVDLNTNADDADFSGVPLGTYEFTYEVDGSFPCSDDEATITVTIEDGVDAGDDNTITICEGEIYDLEDALSAGATLGGNFLDDDGTGALSGNDFNSAGFPDQTFNFTYDVGSGGSCGSDQAVITVQVIGQANAGNDNSIMICTDEMNVDIESLLGTFDSSGSWSDDDATGVDLNVNANNVDFSGVAAGVYNFTYNVIGTTPCSDDDATIIVTIESGANAGDDNTVSVCEGGTYDLLDALSVGSELTGTFNDDSGSGALSGSILTTTGLSGQTFNFTYTVTGSGNCGSDESVITVEIVSTVTAGIDSPNNIVCIGSIIDLFDFIPDANMGGTFLDLDGSGALTGNLFDTSIPGAGVYNFQYMIGDNVICPADMSMISIILLNPPSINYSAVPQLCEGSCFELEFSITGTPMFEYNLNVFDELSNQVDNYNPIISTGLDTLTICNNGGTGQIINDTLSINNSSTDWYIIPTTLSDMNCDLTLEPDTIFVLAGNLINTLIDPTLCPEGSIEVNNVTYDFDNPSGIELLNAISGCDSIVEVDLSFYPPATFLLDPVLCSGSSVEVNNTVYDESNPTGMETFLGASAMGCDSIVEINLMFDNIISNTVFETICDGDSIFLEGAWQFDDGSFTDDFVTSEGCDSIVVTMLDKLDPITGSDNANICNGDSIFLEGAWQFDSGIYEDILTAVGGCDSTVSTMLTVEVCDINVDLTSIGNDCFGGSDGSIKLTIATGDEPYEVMWSGQTSGITGNLTNQNAEELVCIENLSSDQYDINVIGANGSIVFTDMVNIVDNNPTIVGSFDITNASCSQSNGSIDATLSGGFGGFIYNWNPNIGLNADVNNLDAGTYFLTATDEAGCEAYFEIDVDETIEGISFEASTFDVTCLGINDGGIMITDIQNAGTNLGIEVNGITLLEPYILEDLPAGIYAIDITNDEGCFISSEVEIAEGPAISLLDYTTQYQIEAGDSIQIIGDLLDAEASLVWSPSESLSCDSCANPIAFPASSQMYTLTAFDMEGCSEQLVVNILVTAPDETILLPNIFTPDGNGMNDIFEIYLGEVNQASISIFDRWGNTVFEESNTPGENIVWDGRFNGSFVLPGVYVYLLEYTDFNGTVQIMDGAITIIR